MKRSVLGIVLLAAACASLPTVVETLINLHKASRTAIVALDSGEAAACGVVNKGGLETCAGSLESSAFHQAFRAKLADVYTLDAQVATGLANYDPATPVPAQLVKSLGDLNDALQSILTIAGVPDSVKLTVGAVISTVRAVVLSLPTTGAAPALQARIKTEAH